MSERPTQEQVEVAKDYVLDGHGRGLGDPYIGTLSDYIEHLEQIVAKLPVDAEGNPVYPGRAVWVDVECVGPTELVCDGVRWVGRCRISVAGCWHESRDVHHSRAAAEAALEVGDE